jgi:hypothetical protein
VNRRWAQSVFGYTAILALGGCASIVSGRQAEVAFESHPSNAQVVIRDRAHREVASLKTPGVVSLKRNRRFFMPARYVATIEAPGYEPAHVPLRSTVNPWILGNVIFGGIPGFVVDTATGALWTPRQSLIHQQLVPCDGMQPDFYGPIGAAPSDANGKAELGSGVPLTRPAATPIVDNELP